MLQTFFYEMLQTFLIPIFISETAVLILVVLLIISY